MLFYANNFNNDNNIEIFFNNLMKHPLKMHFEKVS